MHVSQTALLRFLFPPTLFDRTQASVLQGRFRMMKREPLKKSVLEQGRELKLDHCKPDHRSLIDLGYAPSPICV